MNTKELQLIADLLVKAHKDEIVREGDWWYGIDGHHFNIHSPDDDGMFHIYVYPHDETTGTDYTQWINLEPVFLGVIA
tara:strand:- start:2191 stop:2424 length:234 start_codon:yes stop_codon:yes gene_type:complete